MVNATVIRRRFAVNKGILSLQNQMNSQVGSQVNIFA